MMNKANNTIIDATSTEKATASTNATANSAASINGMSFSALLMGVLALSMATL